MLNHTSVCSEPVREPFWEQRGCIDVITLTPHQHHAVTTSSCRSRCHTRYEVDMSWFFSGTSRLGSADGGELQHSERQPDHRPRAEQCPSDLGPHRDQRVLLSALWWCWPHWGWTERLAQTVCQAGRHLNISYFKKASVEKLLCYRKAVVSVWCLQRQSKKPRKTKNTLSPQEIKHIHVSLLLYLGLYISVILYLVKFCLDSCVWSPTCGFDWEQCFYELTPALFVPILNY